ncbi:hypothetical protein QNO08_11085 [Arthrobacter sp. zg-Y820]|uniref:hypothetical protein n=1 Tax=unclassified Arthrobacter TaxID=235627 RepID=UPI001E63D135|nr:MULTISPECIES: hypothetical protein [unclassified Arthrobacter]MCC9196336.1 hypothetical protein [Arthrobacter sp. zg-Y820]MDK1279197.1 hypothetical protein [Arthrobacter sp. zg.Y820]WIB08403.1 hypothetical protein QNO08_11085 [Arthrobacter sp. zg-Y820]
MTNGPESADAARRSRRADDVPADAAAGPRERESQQRAGDREAMSAYKALTDKQARSDDAANPPTRRQLRLQQQRAAGAAGGGTAPEDPAPAGAPAVDAPPASLHPVREGGRRDRRRRAEESPARGLPVVAVAKGAETVEDPNSDVAGMTVEQALVAREALHEQARNQVAAMEAIQAEDPQAVDLELLAQQKALADRAAVLNRRTQSMQRLSPENEQRKPLSNDPSTAHNLAMVTPLEFDRVPGTDRPVMRRPPTSHIPIVTSNTSKQAGREVPAPAQGTPRAGDKRFEVRRPSGSTDVRPSRILARADALVIAPLDPAEGVKPVGARSAFGLDPLDVMTAGLGRTRRLRFVSLGIGGLGVIALAISVAIIVGG